MVPHQFGRRLVATPDGIVGVWSPVLLDCSDRDAEGRILPTCVVDVRFVAAAPSIVLCRDSHGEVAPRLAAISGIDSTGALVAEPVAEPL